MRGEPHEQAPQKHLKRGQVLAGGGCLFGLAPILLSIVFALFGNGIGTVLHWYTLYTAPVGFVAVIVGIVLWVNESGAKAKVSQAAVVSDASGKPAVADSHVSAEFATSVRTKYLIGAGIAAALAVVDVAVSFSTTGIGIGAMVLLGGAVWVALIANKLPSTGNFGQLRLASNVVSIVWLVQYVMVGMVIVITFFAIATSGSWFDDTSEDVGDQSGVLGLVSLGAQALAITALWYSTVITKTVKKMNDDHAAPPVKRRTPTRIVTGSLLVLAGLAIAYAPMGWAQWQIASGADDRGVWTTFAVVGIFIWAFASIVVGLGLFVALRRVTK